MIITMTIVLLKGIFLTLPSMYICEIVMTDRFLFLPPARCPRHWSQYKIESAIVSVNACNGIGTNSDPHPHKGAVLDETKW